MHTPTLAAPRIAHGREGAGVDAAAEPGQPDALGPAVGERRQVDVQQRVLRQLRQRHEVPQEVGERRHQAVELRLDLLDDLRVLVVACILLGYAGSQPAEGVWLIIARVASIYYFAHFLIILPLLGKVERPRPLPNSISEPVLTGGGRMAAAAAAKPMEKA